MARAATAQELAYMRSDGQSSRRMVIIDEPNTVYTARATGAVNQTTYTIGFDNGSGTLSDCLADMTLLIGTSAGGSDVGIARLRKAPISGTLYIGADPSLEVEDNDYLTVLNDFEIWAKHPVDTSIDVDVAYSQQFTAYPPIPIMGDDAVIDAGDSITFDASDAWCPGSTISGYSWTCDGASSSSGTTTATPTFTFNTSGRFRVDLLITAANSETATGHRWVYVIGDNLQPEDGAVIDEPEGSNGAGWTFKVLMYDRPSIANRRVILYSEDRYGRTVTSIGPWTGRENIVCVGWIVGETIQRQPGYDTVEFEVSGPLSVMSKVRSLLAGLQDINFPADEGQTALPAWATPTDLYIQKAIHYLAFWRSTIAKVLDVRCDEWNYWIGWVTASDGNLLEQFMTFADASMLSVTSDRYGRLYVERDPQLYPIAGRDLSIPVVMTLTDDDWQGELSIVRRQAPETSMATVEGKLFTEYGVSQIGGRSPGEHPSKFGDIEAITDIWGTSQAVMMSQAGLLAGWKNAEIQAILVTLAENNRMIDIAPRQYVDAVWNSTTYRCVPRSVRFRQGPGNFMFTELELEPRGGEWPAVPILYPEEEEPPAEPPTEPPVNPPEPPTEPPTPEDPATGDAFLSSKLYAYTTTDFDQASPTWGSTIAEAIFTSGINIKSSTISPVSNEIGFGCGLHIIGRITTLVSDPTGGNWTQVYTGEEGNLDLHQIKATPGGLVYAVGHKDVSGTEMIVFLRSANNGETWTEIVIPDSAITMPEYSVTQAIEASVEFGTSGWWYVRSEHERKGTASKKPYGIAFLSEAQSAGWTTDTGRNPGPTNTQINNFNISAKAAGTIWAAVNGALTVSEVATFEGWLNEYFGIGGWEKFISSWDQSMPDDDARIYQAVINAGDVSDTITTWAFWLADEGDGDVNICFDFARTNEGWIVVGTPNKLLRSLDGGFTWSTLADDTGADDVHIDPQAAGAVYYWDTVGDLRLNVGGADQGAILSDSPRYQRHTRIARQLNGGYMWVIDGSGQLRKHVPGQWLTVLTGIGLAGGLRAYLGSPAQVVYLDATKAWYSADGTTFSEKTGSATSNSFSPYGDLHLMKDET